MVFFWGLQSLTKKCWRKKIPRVTRRQILIAYCLNVGKLCTYDFLFVIFIGCIYFTTSSVMTLALGKAKKKWVRNKLKHDKGLGGVKRMHYWESQDELGIGELGIP
jgi:hypothetical protein